MFTVIYSFNVKLGKGPEFIDLWREMTILIREYAGSHGSRLHKRDELTYIAYAQWPHKSLWEGAANKLPEEAIQIGKKMRECCDKVETLFELDVVEDLIKQ